MSDHSSIEWTDATWSPTLGCDKVSEGCRNCYAIRTAYRQEHAFKRPDYAGVTRRLPNGSLNWTGRVNLLTERLALPLHWRQPRRIFVDSQSDLFHEEVPDTFIERVFDVMEQARWHTFQVLTKRPARMNFLRDRQGLQPLPNVWLGVSVEDQRAADERIPLLLQTPAAVRWLSCEPLIGPVKLDMTYGGIDHGIDWLVAGGESGPHCRPLDLDWARALRDQCLAAGVPFLFKQVGGRTHAAGGRLLDGVEWNQYPQSVTESSHAV